MCEVNRNKTDFTGLYETLIITHKDIPGVISSVTKILSKGKINIAFMNVFRNKKGEKATMIFEMDNKVKKEKIDLIKNMNYIYKIISISPV